MYSKMCKFSRIGLLEIWTCYNIRGAPPQRYIEKTNLNHSIIAGAACAFELRLLQEETGRQALNGSVPRVIV